MLKNIIREIAPKDCDFSFYFDGDCFTEAGAGDFCGNLFIIQKDWGRTYGFNHDAYAEIVKKADYTIDAFYYADTINYTNFKEEADNYGLPCSVRLFCALKKWYKHADTSKVETIAEYLTITTGKEWAVLPVRGYCQGDYAEVLFCTEYYTQKCIAEAGDIYFGCAKEFCVIYLDENGEEIDTVYGYFVADSSVNFRNADESYKKIICEWEGLDPAETRLEMYDGYKTEAVYRVA